MAKANECPECRENIHPFAAMCPNCGADLDAHRRRLRTGAAPKPRRVTQKPRRVPRVTQKPRRVPRVTQKARRVPAVPAFSRETTDAVILTIVMLLLALYAPIYGAVFGLFIVWHSVHNGLTTRRNVAIACSALAIFNLMAPSVLLPVTSAL
jgi:hypothetical protein